MRYKTPKLMPEYQMYFDCKGGAPHDLTPIQDTKKVKWEICVLCGQKFRWNKSWKGRIDNPAYLRAHIRNFAQRWGPTKRVYHKIHNPDQCKIKI